MDVPNFSQQKSDEEILREILAKHNLSISDFRVYWCSPILIDEFSQPLWYMIEDNKVKMLRISSEGLTHLDLSRLTNLEKLNLIECNITDLSLSNLPPNLKELDLSENNLTRVDLSGLPNLKKLSLYGNKGLTQIDLSRLPNLEELDLIECNITDLSLSKLPPNLKWIKLSENKGLTRVDLSGLTNLEKLYLAWCNITDLSLSKLPPNLKEIDLSENEGLTQVDLSGLTNLEKLDLGGCKNLKEIILSKDVKDKISITGDVDKINIIWK